MENNRFSDDNVLEIIVTVFVAFVMIFMFVKIMFF
ncbi:hypothetical protein SAMN04488122_3749 [Chitinophaga arvensicola]|uniref:Uncharacterized protein n=1 Tax=Chitinophaga arvensicola TaxID=29529 RepID=A0A1I0S5V3_9BACT|nr:hypothetical protein SAMN04488122_3749 [Chitinophaga arvensicola]